MEIRMRQTENMWESNRNPSETNRNMFESNEIPFEVNRKYVWARRNFIWAIGNIRLTQIKKSIWATRNCLKRIFFSVYSSKCFHILYRPMTTIWEPILEIWWDFAKNWRRGSEKSTFNFGGKPRYVRNYARNKQNT